MTINICDQNALCGHQAAQALDEYIRRLEKGQVEGLTEKQVRSLIKTAKVLRTAVVQSNSPKKTTNLTAVFSDRVHSIFRLRF